MARDTTHGLPLFSTSTEQSFFQAKRQWSKKIKDRVLASYLTPYLTMVATLRKRRIILIDAFAGPGLFQDGSKGSPLIICEAADQHVPDQYEAIFVNKDADHHRRLSEALQPRIAAGRATCIRGDAHDLLKVLGESVQEQTIFLYLDPFGLSGCDFPTLKLFLTRPKQYSTEILINISPRAIHRLAAMDAVREGRITPQVEALNATLTAVLGGGYWREFLADESMTPAERAAEVVKEYQRRLGQYLPYVGSCPVREGESKAIKYYMTFCSRHPFALLLMNDQMCKAYNEFMHEGWSRDTLFERMSWREGRDLKPLMEMIVERLGRGSFARKELNVRIVRDHFMKWTTSEYIEAVKRLVMQRRIEFVDVTGTGRLNDQSLLRLPKPPPAAISRPA